MVHNDNKLTDNSALYKAIDYFLIHPTQPWKNQPRRNNMSSLRQEPGYMNL